MEMVRNNIRSLLAKYILSAVAATLVSGIYEVIDGIFVGRQLGAPGLAAVTLAYPPATVVMAVGSMLAAGCGCLAALRLGAGDRRGARLVCGAGMILWLLFSVALTLAGTLGATPIARLMGADGSLLNPARDFIFWYCAGSLVVVGSLFFDSMIRNSGHPLFSMGCMIGGALLNIVFDAIAVLGLNWELAGVALATVVSQLLVVAAQLVFMVRKRILLRPDFTGLGWNLPARIVWLGLAAFSGTAAIGVMMLLNNWVLARHGGEFQISVFGIMNYVLSLVLLIFIGIALGIQPLISCNYGAGRMDRVYEILRRTLQLALGVGTGLMVVVLAFREPLIRIFNQNDPVLLAATSRAFCWYFPSVCIVGLVFVVAGYFQAIGRTVPANLLLIGKHCLFVIPGLYFLPGWMGVNGIWLATPSGDMLALAVAAGILSWDITIRRRATAAATAVAQDLAYGWECLWNALLPVRVQGRDFRVVIRLSPWLSPDPAPGPANC